MTRRRPLPSRDVGRAKKKRKTPPYTQLTLKHLRKQGYTCAIAEKWNAHFGIRQDLFGFIDIVAIREGSIVGVQSTSEGQRRAHYKKIIALDTARDWLTAGGEIWLVTWQRRETGKTCRYDYTLMKIDHGDFPANSEAA